MRARQIIAIALTAFALTAAGQGPAEERPVYDKSAPERFIEIKPHFGVGMSSVIDNYSDVIPGLSDMQMSPGVMMRPGLDVMFSLSHSVAIGTGISVGINNSRCSLSIIDSKTNSISTAYIKNHYYDVTVPVFTSLRFNLGRRIRCNFDIGVYFCQGIGGKVRTSGYTFGENTLGQSVINHMYYEKDYYEDDMSVVNSVKRFDFGPHVAAGVIYRNHYTFNWVFELSVPNLAVNHNVIDVKYRHLTLAFDVGYIF